MQKEFKQLDELSLATLLAYNHSSAKFVETRKGKRTWESELEALFATFDSFKGSVLDLGCGGGRVLQYLVEHAIPYHRYMGIDYAQEMLEEARRWSQQQPKKIREEWKQGLLQDFTVKDRAYNLITMLASFHHLTTQEDRESCMELCYRALKPGGILWMTNWNPLHLQQYKTHRIRKMGNDFIVPFTNEKSETYERYYHGFTLKELDQLLLYGGFEDIQHQYVTRGEVMEDHTKAWNIITTAVKKKL